MSNMIPLEDIPYGWSWSKGASLPTHELVNGVCENLLDGPAVTHQAEPHKGKKNAYRVRRVSSCAFAGGKMCGALLRRDSRGGVGLGPLDGLLDEPLVLRKLSGRVDERGVGGRVGGLVLLEGCASRREERRASAAKTKGVSSGRRQPRDAVGRYRSRSVRPVTPLTLEVARVGDDDGNVLELTRQAMTDVSDRARRASACFLCG
jgi:hypothetical protein